MKSKPRYKLGKIVPSIALDIQLKNGTILQHVHHIFPSRDMVVLDVHLYMLMCIEEKIVHEKFDDTLTTGFIFTTNKGDVIYNRYPYVRFGKPGEDDYVFHHMQTHNETMLEKHTSIDLYRFLAQLLQSIRILKIRCVTNKYGPGSTEYDTLKQREQLCRTIISMVRKKYKRQIKFNKIIKWKGIRKTVSSYRIYSIPVTENEKCLS